MLYAIHYAWVDGHASKGPVGIWREGGISYYPKLTASHEAGGSQAKTGSENTPWAGWVEKRTEYGSTYGASWNAIESDASMESVLDELQAAFFSEAHPIKERSAPTDLTADNDEPSDDATDQTLSAALEPAARFVIAQSWWIASEIARRHPELIIHEMHPAAGSYDCLAILSADNRKPLIQINRSGSIRVDAAEDLRINWGSVLAAPSPHTVLKAVETASRLVTVTQAPKSTPRVLAYRFIAAAMSVTLNDRHTWDARNELIDSSNMGPGDPETNRYLEHFAAARADLVRTPRLGLWHEPESHFWALLRDGIPVAIVSIEGNVYRPDHQLNLAAEYQRHGRRMLPVVVDALQDLLH